MPNITATDISKKKFQINMHGKIFDNFKYSSYCTNGLRNGITASTISISTDKRIEYIIWK